MSSSSALTNAPFDPQARAEVALDRVLDETSIVTQEKLQNERAVETELKKKQLLETASSRIKSRVLFVTNNDTVLQAGHPTQQTMLDLADVFDEVHIIILGLRGKQKLESVRLANKVWAYTTAARFFLELPFVGRQVASDELLFTDGFRPDIVVALDPYESAASAYLIAERFDRPLQVHVLEDTFLNKEKFLAITAQNKWRLRFMHFVLKRTLSVRVVTELSKAAITKRYKKIEDLTLLPRFFNTKTLLALPIKPEEDAFPQFSFTALFIGDLSSESTLFRALDSVRPLLRTPSIGFVVLGDGPQRTHFKERAKILGIESQVLFLGAPADTLPYLRSTDVLIVTDTSSESDDIVVTAAALGVPLVMSRTPLRNDLFEDGLNAFLCDPEDTLTYAAKLRTFINTNALRTQFSENGRTVIATRIEEDPHMYRLAYRDSIEAVLYQVEKQAPASEVSEKPLPPVKTIVDGIEMKVPDDMRGTQ